MRHTHKGRRILCIHHSFTKLFWDRLGQPRWGTEASVMTQTDPVFKELTTPWGHTHQNVHFRTSVVSAWGLLGALEPTLRRGGLGAVLDPGRLAPVSMLITPGLKGAPTLGSGRPGF